LERLIQGCKLLGIPVNDKQFTQFRIYADELIAWNRQINLTSITDYEEIQTRHFLDSISCLLGFPGVHRRGSPPFLTATPDVAGLCLIDIGAGAGFPGIPLKIICPEIELALLDSVGKKTRFLDHLVRKLDLSGVQVFTARAEEFAQDPAHREAYDMVVSRALAELAVLAELCLPFAKPGGRVLAPKKGEMAEELQAGARAIARLGGRLRDTITVELTGFLDSRFLVVLEKVAPTPFQYPRRPGIPAKRPLR
jgi:16S rRNA (guanine527-N7)-methyltransferase